MKRFDTEEKRAIERAKYIERTRNHPKLAAQVDEWLETKRKWENEPLWSKIAQTVILLACFGAFAFIGYDAFFKPKTPEQIAQAEVRDVIGNAKLVVQSMLKDSGSAEFRGHAAYEYVPGQWAVCGQVNAKNSFGGYTGYSSYISFGNTALFDDHNMKAKTWNGLVKQYCKNHTK